MTGEVGAIGELATGGLLARAVEPRAGESSAGHAEEHAACLNCGTALIGPHCYQCGQSAHVHRSVGAIGHEIAHGVFHFEGKIWRTLPLLLLRPGELTRRYIDGERVRFVSPLALFLFTVFLFFAAVSWVGGDVGEAIPSLTGTNLATTREQALAKFPGAIRDAEHERAVALAAHRSTEDIDSRLNGLRISQQALQTGVVRHGHVTTSFSSMKTGWPRLDRGIERARANPGLLLYKLQSSAYKYSWLLIPLSTPMVALLFLWRRRFGLYDHAVFVTYSIAFMTVLAAVLTLVGTFAALEGAVVIAALIVPLAHMYRQLRGTYALSRRSAAWRTAALATFACVVLGAFAALMMLHILAD